MDDKPRLRALDFQPVLYEGQQMWLLRDPLELSERQLMLPQAMAQMLVYCDGRHTPEEIRLALSGLLGGEVDPDVIHNALAHLDETFLLDNDRSRRESLALLDAYRAQGYRYPALADSSYPADPTRLRADLNAYGQDDDLDGWRPWRGRGIISPHIDYPRGGPVYARVWRRAAASAREAELVLIFGTDHNGSAGNITLTRLPYATPYGLLPTDEGLVDRLAEAIGPRAYAEELHHAKEHSVELSAVWLHHIRDGEPCPMVPILCGSFHHFVAGNGHPEENGRLNRFIKALQRETAGRRVLTVASVDLAHVGPSFGDDYVMDAARRRQLAESDASLIAAINQGDDVRFYDEIAAIQDSNRICGFSSIYLMLRYLGQTRGRQIAYSHCPADPQDHSLVSICGLLLD